MPAAAELMANLGALAALTVIAAVMVAIVKDAIR